MHLPNDIHPFNILLCSSEAIDYDDMKPEYLVFKLRHAEHKPYNLSYYTRLSCWGDGLLLLLLQKASIAKHFSDQNQF